MIGLTDSPVVETNYGRVRGRNFHFGQHSVSAFLGIPYAKPPTGPLRFQVSGFRDVFGVYKYKIL
jgi:carboxylesterase type B